VDRAACLMACSAALTLVLSIVGCDEDEQEPRLGTLTGQTVRLEDGVGYGPLTVALLDARQLVVVALTSTDSLGRFAIENLVPDRYVPVVYDFQRRLFHLPQAAVEVQRGHGVSVTLPMVRYPIDQGPALVGRVFDPSTGLPIARAMVDLGSSAGPPLSNRGSLFSELDGQTGTLNQVTDRRGIFRLWPVWFFAGPQGEIRSPELLISAPGYRGYSHPGFTSEVELLDTLLVALEPGRDQGVVTGRLVDLDGGPVPGLRVGLEWTRVEGLSANAGPVKPGAARALPEVILQNAVGVSDELGRFRIEGEPAGFFKIMAAYPRDDGWLGQYGPSAEIAAGGVADVGDIIVVRAITTLSPLDGAIVAVPLTLSWDAAPHALTYFTTVQRPDGTAVQGGPFSDPRTNPPDGLVSDPGVYLWIVQAFAGRDEVGRTERARSFVVPPSRPGWIARGAGSGAGARWDTSDPGSVWRAAPDAVPIDR
jgi:hypothetical protein